MGRDARAIGVFDSGIGGLTALRELHRLLPDEDIIYFGDTGRVPYGTRSHETIIKYARQDARFMLKFGIKLLLVACNTASYAALDILTGELDIPVFGVIEDAARRAAELTKNGKVAVIATPATIAGRAYSDFLRTIAPEIEVIEKACPLFVPLVENGRFSQDDPVVRILAQEYLSPIRAADADTVILGCTHYPLLSGAIKAALPGAELVSSGAEAAKTVAEYVRKSGLAAPPGARGRRRYFVSDSAEQFRANAATYLCHELDGEVAWVDIEAY